MTVYADPLDRRDGWRALWRILAGDALLLAACLLTGLGLLAALLLPQSPAAGTADPVAFSQWEALARLREGALFNLFNNLGFNAVMRAGWWRLALLVLAAACSLRLFDRVARVLADRRALPALRDEQRVRVAQDAQPLEALAEQFARRGYRVRGPEDGRLLADRAPWAEALSIVMHAGLLLACAGLLMNMALGWEAPNRTLQAGAITPLPGGYSLLLNDGEPPAQMTLQRGDAIVAQSPLQDASLNGIQLAVRQVTPGYRVSAVTDNAQPLAIRASNFVSPTAEVLLNLTEASPEQYVALPDARLALAVSAGAAPDGPARARVFALPSGQVITDTEVQPQVSVGEVTFTFKPARGAVIDAWYAPGALLLWLGLPLALVGLAGALFRPMQRIMVQHHGHWTEFYADGRGARSMINNMLSQPALHAPDERR